MNCNTPVFGKKKPCYREIARLDLWYAALKKISLFIEE